MLERLRRLRAESMPSSAEVVREASARLGYSTGGVAFDEIRQSFDARLRKLFEETLVVLEDYEQEVDAGLILPQLVSGHRPDIEIEYRQLQRADNGPDALQEAVTRLLARWHGILRGLFLSVSQSRKQRGGKDFEYEIRTLLELARIPYEAQSRRERADFLFPSSAMLQTERPKAVLLSVKRTLRERWQQVVRELQDINCPNTYLATAEDTVAPSVVEGITTHNIYVVVWEEVKRVQFPSTGMVVGYNQFIQRVTGLFLPQWDA
jgi:hypothetical protein